MREVSAAASADGLVWIAGVNGPLASVDIARGSMSLHDVRKPVRALITSYSGALWLLVADGNAARVLGREKRNGGYVWKTILQAAAPAADVLALAEWNGLPLIVTRTAIIVDGANQKLSSPLPFDVSEGDSAVATVSNREVLLGLNRGELGGGLRSLSIDTGAVTLVEQKTDSGACGGLFSEPCDPVTSVARDGADGCVLLGVGRSQLTHGHVLRECSGRVTLEASWSEGPPVSDAISDILPTAEGYWAATPQSLHYRGKGGSTRRVAYPAFRTVCGVELAHAAPGVVVVVRERSRFGINPALVPDPEASHPAQ